jgi:hypothetical protein
MFQCHIVENQVQLSVHQSNGLDVSAFLKSEIDQKINHISTNLRRAGFEDFDMMLSGSLVCGHYDGPKPVSHSLNGFCPSEFQKVIEADLRIVVPEYIQVLDPFNVRFFEQVSGADPHFTQLKENFVRFNQQINMLVMYDYTALGDGVGFEYEICVNNQPYYEISSVWHDVFSPDEIEFQKELRKIGRDVLEVDYDTEFQVLKKFQTRECRFRICANLWLQRAFGDAVLAIEDFIPIDATTVPQFVHDLSEEWSTRFSGDGFAHSITLVPDGVRAKMEDRGLGVVLKNAPSRPAWIEIAEAVRNKIQ